MMHSIHYRLLSRFDPSPGCAKLFAPLTLNILIYYWNKHASFNLDMKRFLNLHLPVSISILIFKQGENRIRIYANINKFTFFPIGKRKFRHCVHLRMDTNLCSLEEKNSDLNESQNSLCSFHFFALSRYLSRKYKTQKAYILSYFPFQRNKKANDRK